MRPSVQGLVEGRAHEAPPDRVKEGNRSRLLRTLGRLTVPQTPESVPALVNVPSKLSLFPLYILLKSVSIPHTHILIMGSLLTFLSR